MTPPVGNKCQYTSILGIYSELRIMKPPLLVEAYDGTSENPILLSNTLLYASYV
jgi:hypothetical protein